MRQISSHLTFLHKFFVPLWLALGLLNMWFWEPRIVDPNTEYLRYIVISVFGAWAFWLGWPLKKVSIYSDKLYVSNFRREIAVPISEIVDVRGNVFTQPQRVTIYLRNPTEFGPKIKFLAPYKWFGSWWSTHPVVEELRALASTQNTGAFLTPPPRQF